MRSILSARRGRRAGNRPTVCVATLEPRMLLSGSPGIVEDAPATSPVSAILQPVASTSTGTSSTTTSNNGAVHPLSDVPVLHSDPAAKAKIFLDFGGASAQSWGTYNASFTPAYDVDGDPTTFSDAELADIQQIWARVSEKYSPFNIDVTTQNPGSFGARQAMHEIIGGDGSWINSSWGGATYVGGFATGQTTSFIFSDNLTDGDPHYVSEAIAHEMGHAFGLQHQSTYANGQLVSEYNTGTSQSAPIMGNDYYADRGLWWNGPDILGANDIQNDMAVIASSANGFGYRVQDHGQTIATADSLNLNGTAVSAQGIIETTADTDTFVFSTGAGTISFEGNVAEYGPMLDLKLTLLNSTGNIVAVEDTSSLGETLTQTVPAGTYYIQLASHGSYGDVGQYTLTGTIVPAPLPVAPPTTTPPQVNTQPTAPLGSTPAPTTSTSRSTPKSTSALISLNLTANEMTRHRALLTWDAPDGTVIRIIVQRSIDGTTWKNVGHVGRRSRRMIDHHVPAASTVDYRLVLVNRAGQHITQSIQMLPLTGE